METSRENTLAADLTSSRIRQQFIDFFVEKHGHTFAPSSPVVPHDDPTLLFANAGMNQFKPYFLGTEKPPYPRAVNTQKCIRAGGKHNDLDDVGKDTYHHTFFEMLGNWSFGDYFKAEAIAWAWELLVEVWGLEPARLHATYFEGDAKEGLAPDLEAKKLWSRFLPDEQIHPGSKKDNFWEMGNTGPCGPCSELHYDGTADLTGKTLINQDDPRVIEIWNLVFIQFNRNQDGSLEALPANHVDTGMGFERIVRVLQGKDSNYDTDVFVPLFEAIQRVTGARAYHGHGRQTLQDPVDIAYRVIADHIRTLTFALADGAHCGNEGRAYVLRRVLRRAVRYGRQNLHVQEPFFYKLVPAVVELMGEAFETLKQNPDAIAAELKEEEQSFGRTLDRGIELFEKAASVAENGIIAGDSAFELYATFGFPLDLTELMARERGLSVDEKAFQKCWDQHVKISQAKADQADLGAYLVELIQKHNLTATEFLGYDTTTWSGQARLRFFDLDGTVVMVSDRTPFYAESGGQVGDVGRVTVVMSQAETAVFKVTETRKVGDVFFHLGAFEATGCPGETLFSDTTLEVTFEVDQARRRAIMANHTGTHLLNRALRMYVNPEADQRGSLVDDEKLRFDFSNHSAVGLEQIKQVEQEVNMQIVADLPVYTDYAPQEQALKIRGLRAVFGEKYPPRVRIVSIGPKVEQLLAEPGKDDWAQYSIEFCGGTHLARTGDAEGFCIMSEEAVAKGIRRMTAMTGRLAHQATARGQQLLERVRVMAQLPDEQLSEALGPIQKTLLEKPLPLLLKHDIQQAIAPLQKRVKAFEKEQSKQAIGDVVAQAREIAKMVPNAPWFVSRVPGADGKALRQAMDVIRGRHPETAMLLAADAGGKAAFLAFVPKAFIKQGLKAGDWVRAVAQVTGGNGGGRPDMAQAGGRDISKIDEALQAGEQFAKNLLQP